ncbi:hypothetical protein GGR50DRAFT_617208 [Xylaria sp. CBS 124048]|nr:hypothetical protein GGR50DRAFT_617208 [Xylaria sp. CBS 124048]
MTATLDSLKYALRQSAISTTKEALSDTQYSTGFNILARGSGWTTYQDFIIPQLSQLLASSFHSRTRLSVLEIGPGPTSILEALPCHLRRKISKYAAFEPNHVFAAKMEERPGFPSDTESPFPYLESPPEIRRVPFDVDETIESETGVGRRDAEHKFDVILFCHSMYGMKPERRFVERALNMLVGSQEGGMVVIFHRAGVLHFDGLVCHRTASFPTGIVSVPDEDEALDHFASFIAGFSTRDEAVRVKWRKVCRDLALREEASSASLLFSSPETMVAFTQHATALPELTAHVPVVKEDRPVKSREACLHRPAAIIRPKEVQHIQRCVQWASKHGAGLTIIGGGHSGHCLWSNVVAVDMSNFNQISIHSDLDVEATSGLDYEALVVAGAGCKTGDIIHTALGAGLTVPLGSRPSVGAGLWLQGGIGHLARLHGLACDSIVGAVIIGVDSGQVYYVGRVPSQHRPAGAVRPDKETDLLWAMKGAGTNLGIVVSVTFKAYAAPTYSVRNWIIPMSDRSEASRKLRTFDDFVVKKLPRCCSADAYLYWDAGRLHLGVTMYESATTGFAGNTPIIWGPEKSSATVDCVGLFESEMYMSGMHGGHGGGKTTSFKRCLFLKDIGQANVTRVLIAAIETRPSPFCYLHLLHGGGAIGDTAADATAFGCRDWDFACVITGVWPRDQDETEVARAAVQWVYQTVMDLLPWSKGAYSADLGPDPRDTALVDKAFGPNLTRLARLKRSLDPNNILSCACPVPRAQLLIVLVSGESGAGKDHFAKICASELNTHTGQEIRVRVVSISEATKQEYAAATGTDLNRLLQDRTYKEQHRSALTAFFQDQVRKRPHLLEEHFLNMVHGAGNVDVLFITGMRDDAPVTALSHLVPNSRLLDVRVTADVKTRRIRRGYEGDDAENNQYGNNSKSNVDSTASDYCPSLIFDNTITGSDAAKEFIKRYLLPYLHEDLRRLADMVRLVPDFPRRGIKFRHVLDIAQQPGGLALCTSRLQTHFVGDWTEVNAVVSCEAGGFIYAASLADRVRARLVMIREAGKLPPPTISVAKSPSHISSSPSDDPAELRIEMSRDVLPGDASVVVVDDVLATGKTLCAVLQLLKKAGVGVEHVHVLVVAEFPVHRGRELLRSYGFGRVNIQSLLVFDGV